MQPVKQNPASIQDLIEKVDTGKLALPDFQRKYEWKLDAVKRLLDSIFHGFPAGSLLFLKNTNPPQFSLKNIEGSDELEDVSKVDTLVLDGQQRLTSIYQVVYNKFNKGNFYLNLEKLYELYKENNDCIDDVDFTELLEIKKRNRNAPDVNSIDKYLPLSMLRLSKKKESYNIQRNAYRDKLINRGEKREYIDFIGNDLDEIVRPFFEYEFPVLDLSSDLKMPAICRIFETLNNTGKNLNAFDICVAKFYKDSVNIRHDLEIAIELKEDDGLTLKYPYLRILFSEEKYRIYILQIIALVSNKKHTQNSLASELTADLIKAKWEQALMAINTTLELMDRFGACTKTTLALIPYTPTIIIISAALIDSGYFRMKQDYQSSAKNKIEQYFYYTALTLKYGDAASTQTVTDSKELAKWIESPSSPSPEFMNDDAKWYLEDMLKINGYRDNGARVKMIRCIMNVKDPKDFKTRNSVMSLYGKTDLHHIFPESRYKNASAKGYSIDSVFNLTYISSETNKSIGKEHTNDYIDTLIAGVYNGQSSNFKNVLINHFISNDTFDAFYNQDYDGFIENRAKEMCSYLKSLGINVDIFDKVDPDSHESVLIDDDNIQA